MPRPRPRRAFDVAQDLLVADAWRRGTALECEVVAPDGARRTVRLCFDEAGEASAHLDTIRAWQRSATAVTYVRRGDDAVLLDERATFERAMR